MNLKGLTVLWLLLLISLTGMAQEEKKEIRSGNLKYEKGKYADAETDYRRALEKNKSSLPGSYNLGGALYRQKKYDESIQQYNDAVSKATNPIEKAESLHNLGNSYIQSQKYQEGINAYKQALKLNPSDNDTRYNLAYAQAMLQQQQQQEKQDQKDQNKDDQKQKENQQNKDNQKQDKKDDKQQDNQQDNQNNQDKKDDQKQKPEQGKEQQPKISKEDAERLLKALQNDEKKLQEKMQMKEGQRVKVEKEW